MNREEIIKMAREAGIGWAEGLGGINDFLVCFAALVAAQEREQCAKVCDDLVRDGDEPFADAIRARGTEK